MSSKRNRVVITGVGAVCSLGRNVPEIWRSILDYQVGYRRYAHPDPAVSAQFFGRIDDALDLSLFSKKITKLLPRFAKLGLMSASEALTMAFGDSSSETLDKYYSPFERGVIFGTGWGGQDSTIENNDAYVASGLASPVSNILSMHSVCSGCISINWNFRGYQNTPIAACATSNVSIGDACERIRSGKAKMMLAGGAESITGDYNVWTVDILGALSKATGRAEEACCPFDAKRSGFILSEGGAALCLEALDSALARKATILGEITGYANFSDGYDITAPAEDVMGRYMSISEALRESGSDGHDIDYVNVHGTSTPLNDINETRALKMVFGSQASSVPMSSTKSYTGHLIAAAGAMETIFCLQSIREGIIPATMHLKDRDPECDLDYVPGRHRENAAVNKVLNVNYGFGGVNSALVLEKYSCV